MKGFVQFLIIAFCFPSAYGQSEFREISTGTQYAQQAYFELTDFQTTVVANDSWDLAFTAFGLQDAGIHVNEAAPLNMTPPPVELYFAPTQKFEDTVSEADLTDRLVNSEQSWTYGALNTSRDETNPLDYGWGTYNPALNQVIGNKVFVIKRRDGNYKKLIIDSLVLSTYYFRHADLDGSNEILATIDKANFEQAGMAYYSFSTNATIEEIPTKWDLVFTRYRTVLPEDNTPYDVTGILSHPNIKVAELRGIPVEEVNASVSLTFEDRIDVIGADWKGFDFTSGWFLEDSLSYVVKMPNDQLYKLVFIDFTGSGTGTATFEQTDLGILSSNKNLAPAGASWSVYPNPIVENTFTLSLDLERPLPNAQVSLYNALGQRLWQRELGAPAGFNAYEIELPGHLPTGQYWVRLEAASGQLTQAVFLK